MAFARAAAEFKAEAGHDRRAQGDEIQKLLPCCPITRRQDIGTGAIIAYDYAHPSYKLTKPELLQSLGPPDGSYDESVWYVLAQETNNMIWEISIDFHNDYVVGSTISGSLKSDK